MTLRASGYYLRNRTTETGNCVYDAQVRWTRNSAVHDGEDGEEIPDLTHVAQLRQVSSDLCKIGHGKQ